MNRREFLKLTTAGAGAAMAGCTKRDTEKVVSYFVPPESWIPGQPAHFVSTCTECPAQCGTLVKAYDKFVDGRTRWMPIKFEGLPGHPVNDRRLCMRGQASMTRFYQPGRLAKPMQKQGGKHVPIEWKDATEALVSKLSAATAAKKTNVWLSGRTTGTLSKLVDVLCEKLRIERHAEYEPEAAWEIREANRLIFGVADLPHYAPENADFLLTIGADVLETFGNPVGFSAALRQSMTISREDLEKRRQKDADFRAEDEPVDRKHRAFQWWHIEPHMSLTGANADVRLVIKPGSEPLLLAYLVRSLLPAESAGHVADVSKSEVLSRLSLTPGQAEGLSEAVLKTKIVQRLDDLVLRLRGKNALVIAGGVSTRHATGVSTAVLAAVLQRGLGMHEKKQRWPGAAEATALVDLDRSLNFARVGGPAEIRQLAERLQGGEVGVLFVSRANPVGTLATDAFKKGMGGAQYRVAFAERLDETAQECDLVLPLSNALESWGDAEPRRGVWNLIEPALYESAIVQDPPSKKWVARGREHRTARPLHDSHSEGDILLELVRRGARENLAETWRDYVMLEWGRLGIREDLLGKGFAEPKVEPAAVRSEDWAAAREYLKSETFHRKPDGLVLISMPTVRSHDGSGNDLPLLQEIPDPLTTITYGVKTADGKQGWVSIPSALAKKMALEDGDWVRLESAAWKGEIAVKVQQGLPDGVLTVATGTLGAIPATLDNVTLAPAAKRSKLPVLGGSESQHGRGIIPMDGRSRGHRGKADHEENGLFPPHHHHPYRWAMAIDLEACTGCGACVAACYVENNVPLVGPEEHLKGREMSWIRLEPFYDKSGPEFIPMLCQHCDNAPCEPVCPVFAAYHNPEGLNAQVYNRCVGTRYCSNNCPYKVRRFNWFENSGKLPLVSIANPELSVRPRGVMEKCTFCVQRIRSAKDHAKDEGRLVEDEEVVRLTACAQTCPTRAIAFGNILDEKSLVHKLSKHERGYKVFEELNARPAITYLHPAEPTS